MSKYCKVENLENVICEAVMKLLGVSFDEGYDIADEALENLPTTEVSEDAISRKWLEDNAEEFGGYYEETVYAVPLSILDAAPSVIPKEKEGEWIIRPNDLFLEELTIECSVCHEEQPRLLQSFWIDRNFCPNCGAKMKGADDYERAIEQVEHDALYEPTYNSEDGSM